jgi:hypothetical protein
MQTRVFLDNPVIICFNEKLSPYFKSHTFHFVAVCEETILCPILSQLNLVQIDTTLHSMMIISYRRVD